MALQSSFFATTQGSGGASINKYDTVAQLATETDLPPRGTVVFITGTRQFAMAQYVTAGGSNITTSTAKDAQGNAYTVYWATITT